MCESSYASRISVRSLRLARRDETSHPVADGKFTPILRATVKLPRSLFALVSDMREWTQEEVVAYYHAALNNDAS